MSVAACWRVARAAYTFPRGHWRSAWRLASLLAEEHDLSSCRRGVRRQTPHVYDGSRGLRAEAIGSRRCAVCGTDDVAHDGWVSTSIALICPDCSRAALSGALPYGRFVAAYRGRVGSPRRSLGEAYRALVAFKEREGDWEALAIPLARALAWSVGDVYRTAIPHDQSKGMVLVAVPSYREQRPHMRMLTALASVCLPRIALGLDALLKTRDFTQKGLTRHQRLAESAGAYHVRPAWQSALLGRHVIVADDLMTTGATLEACARVLLDAGAVAVDGAAVVRVIRAPPERVVTLGARQIRIQLRELDSRGRAPIEPEPGSLWVVFACSARCAVTAVAGPYPLPTLDAIGYHRWWCRCGTAHAIRVRREWRGAQRQSIAVGVGDRRPPELLIGVVQGQPRYV